MNEFHIRVFGFPAFDEDGCTHIDEQIANVVAKLNDDWDSEFRDGRQRPRLIAMHEGERVGDTPCGECISRILVYEGTSRTYPYPFTTEVIETTSLERFIAHSIYGQYRVYYGPLAPGWSIVRYCPTEWCVSPHHMFLCQQAQEPIAAKDMPRLLSDGLIQVGLADEAAWKKRQQKQ